MTVVNRTRNLRVLWAHGVSEKLCRPLPECGLYGSRISDEPGIRRTEPVLLNALLLTDWGTFAGGKRYRFSEPGKYRSSLGSRSQISFRILFGLRSQMLRHLGCAEPNHHLKPQRKSAALRACADWVVIFSGSFAPQIARKRGLLGAFYRDILQCRTRWRRERDSNSRYGFAPLSLDLSVSCRQQECYREFWQQNRGPELARSSVCLGECLAIAEEGVAFQPRDFR